MQCVGLHHFTTCKMMSSPSYNCPIPGRVSFLCPNPDNPVFCFISIVSGMLGVQLVLMAGFFSCFVVTALPPQCDYFQVWAYTNKTAMNSMYKVAYEVQLHSSGMGFQTK
jgi:hypothetical protein